MTTAMPQLMEIAHLDRAETVGRSLARWVLGETADAGSRLSFRS
jgi:hypothetical protein